MSFTSLSSSFSFLHLHPVNYLKNPHPHFPLSPLKIMMESPLSLTALAPILLRNILLPLFIYTYKSLFILTQKFKILRFLRFSFVTASLFFLKIFPSFFPSINHNKNSENFDYGFDSKATGEFSDVAGNSTAGDSCIARALTQLLALVNEIPVSSRKFEIVRSYAEKLMDENLEEGYEPLRKVNRAVLSAAFSRALRQLESAVEGDDGEIISAGDQVVKGAGGGYFGLNRVIKTVGYFGDAVWTRFARPRRKMVRLGSSAEKLSAELLWLAQKLAICGSAEEAVCQWASASKLAWVALSAQPRLQGSLVKLSAFLFKQAIYMKGEVGEENNMEKLRNAKMKMLMTWLPLLCRASIGTDAPVLGLTEKAELEKVLGELIESLKHEEEQEKVLSLWLHHFTHCPSSDWPNLHPCYVRWCTASRKLLLLDGK